MVESFIERMNCMREISLERFKGSLEIRLIGLYCGEIGLQIVSL